MKTLLLVRHAKSSWRDGVDDFDRPLNPRGQTDAPAMAERMVKRNITIDAFVSSPANRAYNTAIYFAKAYRKESKEIITIPQLYEPEAKVFQKVVKGLDDQFENVALFSHNSGITDFVNTLTTTKIDEMPTCGIFAVKADVESWLTFFEKPATFWFFDYPKNG